MHRSPVPPSGATALLAAKLGEDVEPPRGELVCLPASTIVALDALCERMGLSREDVIAVALGDLASRQ